MKKNIFLALLVFLSLAVTAQDSTNVADKSVRPMKRNFTVGISMGNSPFFNTGLNINNGANVAGNPTTTPINLFNNSAVNMVGVDTRYFVSNQWAVTFSGALSYNETPYSIGYPAAGDLPAYDATVQQSFMNFTYAVGAMYFFDYKKNDRIMPYLGIAIPVSHARNSTFDPSLDGAGLPVQLGQSHVDVLGIGAQIVAGLDYYIADGIFLGASIRPFSWTSINNTRYPGPGLLSKRTNSYNFSTFVQPMLTLGFKL